GELHDRMMTAGAELMAEAMAALERGVLRTVPQPENGATYAAKISKEETRINWAQDAAAVAARINGLSPFPGAWCEMPFAGRPERVKLLRARVAEGGGGPGTVLDDALTIACGSGAVRLL